MAVHRTRVEFAEPFLDCRQRRCRVPQAGGCVLEVIAVLIVVALFPSAAETEDEAAPGDVVDGAGHIRGQIRVAIGVAADEGADGDALRRFGHGGEQCPPLEVCPLVITVEWEKVVPGPDGIDTKLLGAAPDVAQLGQRCVLRGNLNADLHVRHDESLSIIVINDTSPMGLTSRWTWTTAIPSAASRRAARLRSRSAATIWMLRRPGL